MANFEKIMATFYKNSSMEFLIHLYSALFLTVSVQKSSPEFSAQLFLILGFQGHSVMSTENWQTVMKPYTWCSEQFQRSKFLTHERSEVLIAESMYKSYGILTFFLCQHLSNHYCEFLELHQSFLTFIEIKRIFEKIMHVSADRGKN